MSEVNSLCVVLDPSSLLKDSFLEKPTSLTGIQRAVYTDTLNIFHRTPYNMGLITVPRLGCWY